MGRLYCARLVKKEKLPIHVENRQWTRIDANLSRNLIRVHSRLT
jgi:hypothetical protein